jgi:hypothetical protein
VARPEGGAPMKVSITMPAKFPAGFAAARYHDERGELARIISPVPPSRSAHFGVSRERNMGLTALGAWNRGSSAFGRDCSRAAAPDRSAWRSTDRVEADGDCDVAIVAEHGAADDPRRTAAACRQCSKWRRRTS